MKKKLVSLFLYRLKVVTIVIPMAMAAVFASCKDDYSEDPVIDNPEDPVVTIIDTGATGDLTWSIDSNGKLTIAPTPPLTTAVMPNYEYSSLAPWYDDYRLSMTSVEIADGVTTIGISAFSNCSSLKSITIPDGVTAIGEAAFSNCVSLTSITIPDGVTTIKIFTFSNCSSLKSIIIPNGVTSIGGWAFTDCTGLTNITIPDKVTIIGSRAFTNCISLRSVTIGKGVKIIDSYAFDSCTSLTSIYSLPQQAPKVYNYAFEGVPFSTCTLYLPETNTEYDGNGWSQFTNRIENIR